jgi:ABC-type Fe3+-siderophore transport system permease subunit
VRKLVGNNHFVLLPLSFLLGATLLLYADIVTLPQPPRRDARRPRRR